MTIYEELKADGWREYPDQFRPTSRAFFKQFETPTRCFSNDDKPGIQVGVYVWERDGITSLQLDLCGGLADETWVKIENYSLPTDLGKTLALIPRLLRVWEAFASRN